MENIDITLVPLNSTVAFKKENSGNQLSFLDVTEVYEKHSYYMKCGFNEKYSRKVTDSGISKKIIELKEETA